MRIKVTELKEGYQLLDDVNGLTKHPIVPKKTIITNEIIEVLKAFSVKEVNAVPAQMKNTYEERLSDIKSSAKKQKEEQRSQEYDKVFVVNYMNAVKSYKSQFNNWQSGMPVDINKIRKHLFPLMNLIEKYPFHLLLLQNYVKKGDYLYHHSVATGLIAGYLAKRMELSQGDYYQIALAGCISDCGMAKIDPKILQKENLFAEEYEEIMLHPQFSYRMIQHIPSLNQGVKIAVFQHHERLDGSGYPMGEKGSRIHLYARIIAISDVYHALVCDRIYREKVSPLRALEMMKHDLFGKFDVKILNTFIELISESSLNTLVRLSNGKIAKVVYIDKNNPTRPILSEINTENTISLMENESKDLVITEIIHP